MNQLIKVSDKGLVSAKELYLGLGLNEKNWSRWYPTNIQDNDFFNENIDWMTVRPDVEGIRHDDENLKGGRPTIDFAISIEFAKHIAMMAKTEKSHEYRNYFLKCEKALASQKKPKCIEDVLIESLNEMKTLRYKVNEANANTLKVGTEVKGVKQEVQAIRNIITVNPHAAWRKECNRILNSIGKINGNYKKPKDEAYNELKNRGKCRPSVLISNLKERAKINGMAPSKIEQLNILDVLENEPRLKEIFINIVKEMAIKYKVS